MSNETPQSYQNYSEKGGTSHVGTTWPFGAINEPGTYICNWSGHLLRIPEDAVSPGRSPKIDMVGPEPLRVTKISDNPYITLTKAKLTASNFDLNVNF
jgi:hypothetical protein